MTGLIGAMEAEVSAFIAALEEASVSAYLGMTFHAGTLAGEPVVIARAGVGKVNAALAAGVMCMHYHPDRLINTGVAGALADDLVQGDVVSATSLVQYDMDTTPVGDPLGLLMVRGQNLVELPTDPALTDALCRAAAENGRIAHRGMIATGDRFVAGAEAKARIRAAFPAVACEMEGGAVAHAAFAAAVPCAVLRVISDGADGSAAVDYPAFVRDAALLSQHIVLSCLASLHT